MATTRRERLERLEAARRRREQAYLAHRQRYEAWSAQEERLRGLVPKALAVLERALDDPEQGPKLALAVLKAVGLWGLEPVRRPDAWAYQLAAEFEDALATGGEAEP
ncbi:hypothetical protein NET02_14770 [Thermomicrobiaceae bacterium CFH 74404]|uniref:Uncharacterized protein n=1 Tax=Thermalbibacter longus TaxID=2951981 RepID=A0AA41WJ97_9BACT|nr:hypothetical protein [Thermalbibacter longus]MCM8750411.1 hypothetical protein [Thermalbibacter longus]